MFSKAQTLAAGGSRWPIKLELRILKDSDSTPIPQHHVGELLLCGVWRLAKRLRGLAIVAYYGEIRVASGVLLGECVSGSSLLRGPHRTTTMLNHI